MHYFCIVIGDFTRLVNSGGICVIQAIVVVYSDNVPFANEISSISSLKCFITIFIVLVVHCSFQKIPTNIIKEKKTEHEGFSSLEDKKKNKKTNKQT
jgi:hypothetical protein